MPIQLYSNRTPRLQKQAQRDARRTGFDKLWRSLTPPQKAQLRPTMLLIQAALGDDEVAEARLHLQNLDVQGSLELQATKMAMLQLIRE